jgi:dienelactone hydrolase
MTRLRYPFWLALALVVALSPGCKRGDPAAAPKVDVPEAAALPKQEAGTHRPTTTLPGGGTLRYTISVPPGLSADKPAPLVVVLHYGGDVTPFYGADIIDEMASPGLGELGPVIVSPDALGGGDWTTAQNEKSVIWLTKSVMKTYPIDPKRVVVTGFSMGGQGAWFIAGRHQDLFTAAIPVAGEPAGADLEWKIPVYVIHSQNDEIIKVGPAKQHAEALKAKGAKLELKVISGPTHYQTPKYAAPLKEAVPWLREAWK